MKIENIFTNFLAEEILHIDNSKIERFCHQERERDNKGLTVSNVGGWQSEKFQYFPTEFQDIYHVVEDRFKYLLKYFNFKEYEKNIMNFWININSKKSFHTRHTHPLSLFSAVYYVKVPPGSGNIVFINPSHQNAYSLYISHEKIDLYNSFNAAAHTVIPTEGKLIIFPSWLQHEITPSVTEELRISISFNSFGPLF